MEESVRGRVQTDAWRARARRLANFLLVLFASSFLTFLLVDLAPGDTASAIVGIDGATPEQLAAVREGLGLDRPLAIRYADWLGDAVRGDLGKSSLTRESVSAVLSKRIPVTIEIAVLSLGLALVIAVPTALFCAHRVGGLFDRTINTITSALVSMPSFLVAMILLLILAVHWRLLPVTGWTSFFDSPTKNFRYVALPVLTLATGEVAVFTRLLRSDLLATLQEDFILAAKSTGISTRRLLFAHALRPSSLSLVTLAGISLGRLIGGTVIVEVIFAIPGVGQLLISSIYAKDVVAVQGTVLVIATGYVLLNGFVDGSYRMLDPRIRIASVQQ